MKTRNCKVRYSYSDKMKTLRLLESNGFNYLQTSQQTKIARPTIKKWEMLYGNEVFTGKSPTEEALVQIDIELKNNDIQVIRGLYILRKRTLQRVMTMAEKETRLESLLKVLVYTSGELDKFSKAEKEEEDPNTDYIAYITKILLDNKAEQETLTKQGN